MKKTISINISQRIFNIDEDAYEVLKKYLGDIEARYRQEVGKDEIIEDIESRIAEELEKLSSAHKKVIILSDVETVIRVLGRVEDFDTATSVSIHEATPQSTDTSHKRLYRNGEDTVFAGVASGLAIYFGLDVVLVRLLFVICIFAGGFSIPLYIILWIITPKAITPAQKAEMRGEPLTLQKIVNEVKESVENGKKRFGL
jgi:phage shock protein PspC (stress-responsive transcriptional regulator)